MFQLSDLGEDLAVAWNDATKKELRCSIGGCDNDAIQSCALKCSTRLFCSYHAEATHHVCKGRQAVLVEDCSGDFPFLMHFPQNGDKPEILSQVLLAERLAKGFSTEPEREASDAALHLRDLSVATTENREILCKLAVIPNIEENSDADGRSLQFPSDSVSPSAGRSGNVHADPEETEAFLKRSK